jgi:hypothetical protein
LNRGDSSDTRGVTFFGRSDAILKPSGVRIGTTEIYNIVKKFEEIADSTATGQNWEGVSVSPPRLTALRTASSNELELMRHQTLALSVSTTWPLESISDSGNSWIRAETNLTKGAISGRCGGLRICFQADFHAILIGFERGRPFEKFGNHQTVKTTSNLRAGMTVGTVK